MLFALMLVTERPAAGRGLVAPGSSIDPSGRSIRAARDSRDRARHRRCDGGRRIRDRRARGRRDVGPGRFGHPRILVRTRVLWEPDRGRADVHPEILGVAHLRLPCGTLLTLTHGGRAITVPVIDRAARISRGGPSIAPTRRSRYSGAPTCARFGCTSGPECAEIARTLDGRPSVGMELAARPCQQAAGTPLRARVSEGVSGCRRPRAR